MESKRSRLEIKADILDVARTGAIKTRIVYGANLNFNIIKPYLSELANEGRLRINGRQYFTTDKGLEYIEHIEAIKNCG